MSTYVSGSSHQSSTTSYASGTSSLPARSSAKRALDSIADVFKDEAQIEEVENKPLIKRPREHRGLKTLKDLSERDPVRQVTPCCNPPHETFPITGTESFDEVPPCIAWPLSHILASGELRPDEGTDKIKAEFSRDDMHALPQVWGCYTGGLVGPEIGNYALHGAEIDFVADRMRYVLEHKKVVAYFDALVSGQYPLSFPPSDPRHTMTLYAPPIGYWIGPDGTLLRFNSDEPAETSATKESSLGASNSATSSSAASSSAKMNLASSSSITSSSAELSSPLPTTHTPANVTSSPVGPKVLRTEVETLRHLEDRQDELLLVHARISEALADLTPKIRAQEQVVSQLRQEKRLQS